MRMIRWMYGYTRMDRISNGVIRDLVKVASIEDRMRERRLRWFAHVKRMIVGAQVRSCERVNILEGKRGRGRPKQSLNKVITKNLKVIGLTDDMAHDRRL